MSSSSVFLRVRSSASFNHVLPFRLQRWRGVATLANFKVPTINNEPNVSLCFLTTRLHFMICAEL